MAFGRRTVFFSRIYQIWAPGVPGRCFRFTRGYGAIISACRAQWPLTLFLLRLAVQEGIRPGNVEMGQHQS